MNTRDIAKLVYDVASHRANVNGSKGIDRSNFICGYLLGELEQVLNGTSKSNQTNYIKMMQERLL